METVEFDIIQLAGNNYSSLTDSMQITFTVGKIIYCSKYNTLMHHFGIGSRSNMYTCHSVQQSRQTCKCIIAITRDTIILSSVKLKKNSKRLVLQGYINGIAYLLLETTNIQFQHTSFSYCLVLRKHCTVVVLISTRTRSARHR